MLRLGRLELESEMPVIAVVFGGPTDPRLVREALDLGMDLAEVRIDLFSDTTRGGVLAEVAKFREVPTIATIRSRSEGGQWKEDEARRLDLFRAVVPHVDAVDIELRATEIRGDVVGAARDADKAVVVSFHDFERTPAPEELLGHVDEAMLLGADIVKIATLAESDHDIRTLAEVLLTKRDARLIVIAMGAHGRKSRVFFPALGSLVTFAAFSKPSAPGQMWLREMTEALRAFYPGYAGRRPAQAKTDR